jgi:SAM-dependent methyltransferase
MKTTEQDPIGQAILDYHKSKKPFDIVVSSDLCDDDIIPIEVLFRSYKDMPELEQLALKLCKGQVLDAGAGAGVHANELIKRGHTVLAIDSSEGAVEYMKGQGISAKQIDFESYNPPAKFDTILLLMNGIGIAKKKSNLLSFLKNAGEKLNQGGQILCDSSDVKYLYEDEDGSYWMDLNSEYYGNFKFQMHYKKISGPEFPWLYVDFDTLHEIASQAGFKCTRVYDLDAHFLAQLTKN